MLPHLAKSSGESPWPVRGGWYYLPHEPAVGGNITDAVCSNESASIYSLASVSGIILAGIVIGTRATRETVKDDADRFYINR